MTKQKKPSKAARAGRARARDEVALDDGRLDEVRGGAPFLSGSLTTGEAASPVVDPRGGNGFIMRDTVIIRTGG